jgi:hypothetical protein
MNEELIISGGGRVTVALGEAGFTRLGGAWFMTVPVARYQDGEWQDGGTVYTPFDYEGLISEATWWAHGSVRAAHETQADDTETVPPT